MHVGCTLAFVCWLSCSLSLLSCACWCMTMHTFLFLYVCVSAVKVVCMFGRADIKAGHAHTCAGLYGAAVDLFVESLPLLSSFLLLSFGKWPCHPLLQRTLIYTCLNSTGEREKQNERGTEEKTWTLPNLCELCRLSRLVTTVMNCALTPELPLPLTLLLPEKWKMSPHRYTLEHLKPCSMPQLSLNFFTVCPHIDLQPFIHTQKYTW